MREASSEPIAVAADVSGQDRPMSIDEIAVAAALAVDETTHVEDVIARCGMTPARVAAALMSLEIAGRARQLEGQRWIAAGVRSRRR